MSSCIGGAGKRLAERGPQNGNIAKRTPETSARLANYQRRRPGTSLRLRSMRTRGNLGSSDAQEVPGSGRRGSPSTFRRRLSRRATAIGWPASRCSKRSACGGDSWRSLEGPSARLRAGIIPILSSPLGSGLSLHGSNGGPRSPPCRRVRAPVDPLDDGMGRNKIKSSREPANGWLAGVLGRSHSADGSASYGWRGYDPSSIQFTDTSLE